MRTIDGLEDPVRPWMPCPTDVKWLAMCARFRDRFPTSLLWPAHTAVYRGSDQGGVVIRPADARALCAYHGDGTTMSKGGNPCPEFCTEPGAKWWRCAWPANALQRMMENQDSAAHNEVVLDSSTWVSNLPHTVEAFFAVRWPAELLLPPHYFQPVSKQRVHRLHQEYLHEYGLSSAEVPLLVYDAARTPPFGLLEAGEEEET